MKLPDLEDLARAAFCALVALAIHGCGAQAALQCTPWPSPLDPAFCDVAREARR